MEKRLKGMGECQSERGRWEDTCDKLLGKNRYVQSVLALDSTCILDTMQLDVGIERQLKETQDRVKAWTGEQDKLLQKIRGDEMATLVRMSELKYNPKLRACRDRPDTLDTGR